MVTTGDGESGFDSGEGSLRKGSTTSKEGQQACPMTDFPTRGGKDGRLTTTTGLPGVNLPKDRYREKAHSSTTRPRCAEKEGLWGRQAPGAVSVLRAVAALSVSARCEPARGKVLSGLHQPPAPQVPGAFRRGGLKIRGLAFPARVWGSAAPFRSSLRRVCRQASAERQAGVGGPRGRKGGCGRRGGRRAVVRPLLPEPRVGPEGEEETPGSDSSRLPVRSLGSVPNATGSGRWGTPPVPRWSSLARGSPAVAVLVLLPGLRVGRSRPAGRRPRGRVGPALAALRRSPRGRGGGPASVGRRRAGAAVGSASGSESNESRGRGERGRVSPSPRVGVARRGCARRRAWESSEGGDPVEARVRGEVAVRGPIPRPCLPPGAGRGVRRPWACPVAPLRRVRRPPRGSGAAPRRLSRARPPPLSPRGGGLGLCLLPAGRRARPAPVRPFVGVRARRVLVRARVLPEVRASVARQGSPRARARRPSGPGPGSAARRRVARPSRAGRVPRRPCRGRLSTFGVAAGVWRSGRGPPPPPASPRVVPPFGPFRGAPGRLWSPCPPHRRRERVSLGVDRAGDRSPVLCGPGAVSHCSSLAGSIHILEERKRQDLEDERET
ncbi:uncharacterized protein LOC141495041 [Macrotis lagotis]|uniref:uncharacterized protein LOC141495041 n=1 Tax=Macrotis lagotis TaxID=92651 RepID=UPI003D68FBF8